MAAWAMAAATSAAVALPLHLSGAATRWVMAARVAYGIGHGGRAAVARVVPNAKRCFALDPLEPRAAERRPGRGRDTSGPARRWRAGSHAGAGGRAGLGVVGSGGSGR